MPGYDPDFVAPPPTFEERYPEDHIRLAERCLLFMNGTKRLYDGKINPAMRGDMWLFELYHHLNDCAAALRRRRVDAE